MSTNTLTETVQLEWWNGKRWCPAGQPFFNERNAWISLGMDNLNYRTIDSMGRVLTDKRIKPKSR